MAIVNFTILTVSMFTLPSTSQTSRFASFISSVFRVSLIPFTLIHKCFPLMVMKEFMLGPDLNVPPKGIETTFMSPLKNSLPLELLKY